MSGGKGSTARRSRKVGGVDPSRPGSGGTLGSGGDPAGDPCNLRFDVDLTGVRASAAAGLVPGSVLDIVLHQDGSFETVVGKRRPDGVIVGTLANVEGLDVLIGCLRSGNFYEGAVMAASATHCRVAVRRVTR